ncbi:MAG: alpha-L-fucosidase [Bacteroidetes bacterium]|nr:alpha-L-fucosidase [Bacteroidota bacterium]
MANPKKAVLDWFSNTESKEEVLAALEEEKSKSMNLLLNTGSMPKGDIHPADVKTLREVGEIKRDSGH